MKPEDARGWQERTAKLLGYKRDGDSWRPVRWRRVLTRIKWWIVWPPS